ncbi:MAG: hypothetical protein IIZ13_06745 [Renibacterium sp.]|nr:hypothetical protein [Renibacterium sp.]
MAELGEASWIMSGNRPLHGWVHRPTGSAVKGAVVIAPPLAREQVISYRSLRVLAIMLAQQGWVAIRFGWTGTGESAPMPESADPVALWHQDLQAVVGLAERIVEPGKVHALGLRVGAALLASAPLDLGKRLLWEPVGGRMFLRQQSMLRAMSLPEDPVVPQDAGVEVNGALFLPHQASALSAVPNPAKAPPGTLPPGTEISVETDVNRSRKVHSVASIHAEVPTESLQRLIDSFPESGRPVLQRPWAPVRAITLAAPAGRRIVEELVEVGPDRLPGVYSRPLGSSSGTEAAAFFVAASAEPKDGVTALWVEAARNLAARGVPALRAERRGCGDLGVPEALMDPNPYTLEAIEDTENTAAWLHAKTGGSVTGIGLCVGAWLVSMASEHAPIDRVVMFNNVAWRSDADYFRRAFDEWNIADDPVDVLSSAARDQRHRASLKSTVKELLRAKAPYPLWLTLGRHSIANTPEVLMDIGSRQSELRLYFGPVDHQHFISERGPAGLRNLQRSGRVVTHHAEPVLDHSLMGHAARLRSLSIIEELFPLRETGPRPQREPGLS